MRFSPSRDNEISAFHTIGRFKLVTAPVYGSPSFGKNKHQPSESRCFGNDCTDGKIGAIFILGTDLRWIMTLGTIFALVGYSRRDRTYPVCASCQLLLLLQETLECSRRRRPSSTTRQSGNAPRSTAVSASRFIRLSRQLKDFHRILGFLRIKENEVGEHLILSEFKP